MSEQAIIRRVVKVSVEDSWLFSIECPECPLAAHTKALNLPTIMCASGVITNAQGAVPMHKCKHYAPESIATEADGATRVGCSHVAEAHG